jgi:hypothetical protein
MDNEKIAAHLRDLANNSPARGKTARLRELLPDVEAALSAGVPSTEIRAALAEHGLVLTHRTFHGTLYRLRRQACSVHELANPTTTTVAPARKQSPHPSPPDGARTPTTARIKTKEQLRAENPTMPMIQLSKLYARQYDRPSLTADVIEELKRKFPQKPKL